MVLKSLFISKCDETKDIETCHVKTEVENFRGLEKESLIITTDENEGYKIKKVLVEVQ